MRQSRKEEIYQNTEEWNQALYHLQLMSGQPSLKIINLYKYQQPTSNHSDISQVDSLVDITDFKRQYKEKVFSKTIPLQDVVFFCGHINIQTQSMLPSKIFTYLICKVGLGRIGTFEDAKYQTDSIYIEPERQDEPFHYSFLVKSHKQYQVKYEVSFKIGDEKEFINNEIRCSICQKHPSTLYCVQEKMYFCDDCGRNHHVQLNNPKSKFKHQLQKLNRVNTLPLCEIHSVKNEFYCLKCQKYVCNICCQKGLHSQNREHIVKPIEFLYDQKRQNNDLLPIQPQQKLQKLLLNSSNRSLQIQANYETVKDKLMKEFDKALSTLETLFKDKLIRVRSDEIELNMINQKIEWTKAFIKIQQKSLKPVYYFKLQGRFQSELRALTINNYQNAFVIEADLAAHANIMVANKQFIQNVKQSTKGQSENVQKEEIDKFNKSNSFIGKRQQSLLVFDPKRQPPRKGELGLLLQNSNLTFFKSIFSVIQLLLQEKSKQIRHDQNKLIFDNANYFIYNQLMKRNNYPYSQSVQVNNRTNYISPICQQTLQSLPKIYGTIKKRILFSKEKFYENMQRRYLPKNINRTETEQDISSLQESGIFKKLGNVKVKDLKMRKGKVMKHQKHYSLFSESLNRYQNRSIPKNIQQLNLRRNDNETRHKVKFNTANFVAPQQNTQLFSSDNDYFCKPTKQKGQKQIEISNLSFSSEFPKFSDHRNKMIMTQQIQEEASSKQSSYRLIRKHYTPKGLTNNIHKSLDNKNLSLKTDFIPNKDLYEGYKKGTSAQTEFSRRLNPINNKGTDLSSNEDTKYIIPKKSQYKQYIESYQPMNPGFNLTQLIYKDTFQIIPYRDSVYFGEVIDQIKKGMGVFVTQQSIFEGIFDNNQKLKGYQKNIDGVYRGFFKEGLREGAGKFQWNNGQIFEGQWKSGKKHGKGVWVSPAGDSYQGSWINGRQHGKGVHKHKNSTYQGQFVNGLKHGSGEQTFSNGDQYKGFYENGKPHGNGRYDWSDGSYYEGQFKQGYREGKGILKQANGTYYKGSFKRDFKHGFAIQIEKSGQKFEGEFDYGSRVYKRARKDQI